MSVTRTIRNRFTNKQGLFRNFSVLMICHALSNFFGLLINIYVARKLQPDLFGLYGVVTTWVSLLVVYASLGIQQVVIRKVAIDQNNSQYYYNISRITRYIGSSVVIAVFILYAHYYTEFNTELIWIIVVNLLFTVTFDTVQNIAFGMQRMELNGYVNVIGQATLLITYILLPETLITVENVLYILLAVTMIKYLAYRYFCKKDNIFRNLNDFKIRRKDVLLLAKESFPFYVLAVFTMFSAQFPVIYLSQYSGNQEVAFFNTASKLMIPLSLTINTLLSSVFPKLAQDAQFSIIKIIERFRSISSLLVIIGTYGCLSIALFKTEFVTLLYGNLYKEAGDVMVYQSWFLVFNAIFSLIGSTLAALKHDKELAILSFFYAGVNTPIFWLLSHYGAVMLSYGYIVGSIINMIYHFIYLNRVLNWGLKLNFALRLFGLIFVGIALSSSISLIDNLFLRSIIWIMLTAVLLFHSYKSLKSKLV